MVQFHRDRVREGAAPEVDLLRIEVERDRLESAARTAAQDAERTRIAVFREMGKTEFPAVEFAEALDQAHPVAYFPLDQVLDQRPEMKLAREAVEQARANLRLQEANAKPDPDVHVGYKRTGGFDTLYAARPDSASGSEPEPGPGGSRGGGGQSGGVVGRRHGSAGSSGAGKREKGL